MSVHKLRWFAPARLLGLLGIPPQQPLLYILFGLFIFTPFFWVDERTEANLGRAAAFAYVVTLIAFLVSFLLLAVVVETRDITHITPRELLGMLVIACGAIYALHLLSFTISYSYFDARGR